MPDEEGFGEVERSGDARLRDALRRARRRLGRHEGAALGNALGSANPSGFGNPDGFANPDGFGDDSDKIAPPRRVRLLQFLTTRCSAEDLRTLCFVLGVNHEVLPEVGKAAQARELVAYFDRRQDLDTLVAALRSLRADLGEDG